MSGNQVSCPQCGGPTETRSAETEGEYECSQCLASFKSGDLTAVVPELIVRVRTPGKLIPVRCLKCRQKFGVKPGMTGKMIACPACQFRQKLQLIPEGADTQIPANPTNPLDDVVARDVFNLQRPSSEPLVSVDCETVETAAATNRPARHQLSPRAAALLPAKYTVSPDIEAQVSRDFLESPVPNLSLGIDTEVTRIQHRNQAVEVRSLSLDEKRRRKSRRVVLVYLLSVTVLMILLAWLIWSGDSGS